MTTDQPTIDPARAGYQGLASRAAELGIPLWHCDPLGKIIIEPPDDPRPARGGVEFACQMLCKATKPAPVEISPGQWLVPIEDRIGSRRVAMNVALVRTNDPDSIRQAQAVLKWSSEDLARAQNDGRTLDQFSEKLSQAYEEINLLYRLARLLNCAGDPVESIESIASQLQQILPFNWLAIRFRKESHGVQGLAGKMVIAGKPPCDSELIRQLSDAMLNHSADQPWRKLLEPHRDPLADATGAEVLAETITHDQEIIGLLLAGNKYGPDPELSSFEMQFLEATAGFLSVFHENLARFAEQREMFLGTVFAMTAAIDAKDRYTRGHSERVGLMASKMAAAMGMNKHFIEQYRIAGLVHDVGKIGVPEAVLCKPGRLTDEEFAQIKLHPQIGYNILKDIPSLAPVLPGVLSHHERWDGRGYPNRIAGEQIPLIARVLTFADTFDAMSSDRAYRPALPRPRVLEEIIRCAGTQFDPSLASTFVQLDFSDFDQALRTHREFEARAA